MAVIDVIMPSARGVEDETRISLLRMIDENQCRHASHPPWECPQGKHDIMWLPPFGTSIIHWTRNLVVSMALYAPHRAGRPPCDFVLMMDDDMVVKPHMLKRLLSHNLDFVAGICTARRDPPIPNIRYWRPDKHTFLTPSEWEWDSQKLIEPDAVGSAFVLVKRKVLEDMAEGYLSCLFDRAADKRKGYPTEQVDAFWDKKEKLRRANFDSDNWKKKDCWWFQFLDNVDVEQLGEFGEDISFSIKAKQLGYRIFADPQVYPGHIGKYAYNIHDHIQFVADQKAKGNLVEVTDNNPAFDQPLLVRTPEEVEVA